MIATVAYAPDVDLRAALSEDLSNISREMLSPMSGQILFVVLKRKERRSERGIIRRIQGGPPLRRYVGRI
jgi:hypothetical protein